MKIFLDEIEISMEELIEFMEEIRYRAYPNTTIQLIDVDKDNMFFSTNYEY
jgi:hypothetical protein